MLASDIDLTYPGIDLEVRIPKSWWIDEFKRSKIQEIKAKRKEEQGKEGKANAGTGIEIKAPRLHVRYQPEIGALAFCSPWREKKGYRSDISPFRRTISQKWLGKKIKKSPAVNVIQGLNVVPGALPSRFRFLPTVTNVRNSLFVELCWSYGILRISTNLKSSGGT